MKCGGLKGARADKKVQIGKCEQDPVTFLLSLLSLFFNAQLFQLLLSCGVNESNPVKGRPMLINASHLWFPWLNMSDHLVCFSSFLHEI